MADNCTEKGSAFVHYVPFLVAEVALALFVCIGNILTIIAVWKTSVLQTIPNMYVVSLATADLLVGALALPSQIAFLIPTIRNAQDGNKAICLFGIVSFIVSATTSIFSMGVIAVDRAFYIGYPFHYNRLMTVSKAKIIIAGTWILSVIISTIPVYYNNWNKCDGCSIFTVIPLIYQVYIQIASVILISILTASCYIFIFKIALSKHDRSSQSASDRVETEVKLIKTFMLVFGLFVICWLPLIISTILGHYTRLYSRLVFIAALILASGNSGMNFFVYAVKNRDFRLAFVKILCRRGTGMCSTVYPGDITLNRN